MPRKKYQSAKPLEYEPTEEQVAAFNWGVYRYIIGPLAINGNLDHYRIGIATTSDPTNVSKDPKIYAHDEVMEQVYKYYLYYYDKRSKDEEGDSSI